MTTATLESGAEILTELAAALQTIGVGSKPELMKVLDKVSRDHHLLLAQILERLPSATVKPVVETVIALTDPTSGIPGTEKVHQLARHLGLDPRSYREAAKTLELLGIQNPVEQRVVVVNGYYLALGYITKIRPRGQVDRWWVLRQEMLQCQ